VSIGSDSVQEFRNRLRQTFAAQAGMGVTIIRTEAERLAGEIAARAPEHLKGAVRVQVNGLDARVMIGDELHETSPGIAAHARVQVDGAFGTPTNSDLVAEALAVEFGTHRHGARPFFFSTYREQRRAMRSRIADALLSPIRWMWD
jgi:hypothetical protein